LRDHGQSKRSFTGRFRTENFDLASLEIDLMRNAWVRFTERFAGNRPDAFDGNPHYSSLFTGVNARLVGVDLMLKTGRLDAARSGLNAVRKDFYELRKASGVVVLADCVRDANAAMDELMVYNDRTLDWNKPGTDSGVAGKASAYAIVLERCDNIAGEPIRTSPEFRRLVDGAKASLALIPKAIAARDGDLLHRVLIEPIIYWTSDSAEKRVIDAASTNSSYPLPAPPRGSNSACWARAVR
jgi:hypothetical protein